MATDLKAASARTAAFKLPKTLAACADLMYQTREERYALQKQVDAKAALEAKLREHLINNLPKSEASGVSGRVANAAIKMQDVVKIEDWDKYYAFIVAQYKKVGESAFAFLQKRPGDAAVKEFVAAKKSVPGAAIEQIKVVSLTKI